MGEIDMKKECSVAEVMSIMETWAPKRLAEDWDNPGLLVGSPARRVSKIMTCLDVLESVADEAIERDCGLIIAHHPVIFRGQKNLRTDLPLGRLLQKLLSRDIAVIAAHTNLDIAEGGVNDVLAGKLGLRALQPFMITDTGDSLGRVGEIEAPLDLWEFAKVVRDKLGAGHVRLVRPFGSEKKPVKRVAVCSGAGGEFIDKAVFAGANVYVTGDVKYHEARHAQELGLPVIDAGHFFTEQLIAGAIAGRVSKELTRRGYEIDVREEQGSTDPFEVI